MSLLLQREDDCFAEGSGDCLCSLPRLLRPFAGEERCQWGKALTATLTNPPCPGLMALTQSSLKKKFVLNFQDNVQNCNSFTAQKKCKVCFPTIWEEGGTVVSW